MSKKDYVTPEIKVIKLEWQKSLLESSSQSDDYELPPSIPVTRE
jgi:hypothetical protein